MLLPRVFTCHTCLPQEVLARAPFRQFGSNKLPPATHGVPPCLPRPNGGAMLHKMMESIREG